MLTIHRRQKAFTLIELLVVISVIGMLSSIVLVSLASARAKGVDSSRIQAVSQVRSALELYASNNGGKYPIASASLDTLEELVQSGGPLNAYLKSLPSKISSVKTTQYSSDGTYYELYVTSETGGQFAQNTGCNTTNYNTYNSDTGKAYCIGSVGVSSGGGMGSGDLVLRIIAQTSSSFVLDVESSNDPISCYVTSPNDNNYTLYDGANFLGGFADLISANTPIPPMGSFSIGSDPGFTLGVRCVDALGYENSDQVYME